MGALSIAYFVMYRVSMGRYEHRDRKQGAVSYDSLNKNKNKKAFSLEEEYEVSYFFLTRQKFGIFIYSHYLQKMKSQIDLSNWENKRIPDPEKK